MAWVNYKATAHEPLGYDKYMKRLSTREAITQFLFIEDKPVKADLVFVFGSENIAKMDLATKLYKQGLVPQVFISGGTHKRKAWRKTPESRAFADRAIEQGVDPKDILIETKSANTLENIVFSKPIIAKKIGWKNIKKVIFICHTFHPRRVLMTATKHWPGGIKYFFAPVVDERRITKSGWWQRKISRERVFEELRRIGEYAKKGDLSDAR